MDVHADLDLHYSHMTYKPFSHIVRYMEKNMGMSTDG